MRSAIRKPGASLLAAAGLASAAGLAAGTLGTGVLSAGDLERAREAAALSSRLRALLPSLPSPPPRCAAACLPDDTAAAPGPGDEVRRLAGALAALPGQPGSRQRTARLEDVIRTAMEDPAPRDGGAEGLRREAEILVAGVEEDAQLRMERAGEALRWSLPWALGGGGAALALGLLSLGALARQSALRRRAEEGKAALLRAAEQVRDLVTIADEKGRIQYVNKAVEEVTGYSRRDLVGTRSDSWLPWYR
ncbi:MAG TPA: PAS domain-containing protein, partial [Anaeromyxobacteraceae bacterium]|nr:PAS domain-containing protein [Anaeromyxobacteraceae bacterium]